MSRRLTASTIQKMKPIVRVFEICLLFLQQVEVDWIELDGKDPLWRFGIAFYVRESKWRSLVRIPLAVGVLVTNVLAIS